jgi:hypothetical protein
MTTGSPPLTASQACARCGVPLGAGGAYLDSEMRAVCKPCHAKDQLDQVDLTTMEDELALQRAKQRKLILRLVAIGVGLLVALLAVMGR